MRARSSLERLANAGSPLLADADALVDAGEKERILERIMAAERLPVRRHRPPVIALVATVVLGVTVAAVVMHRDSAPLAKPGRHHHIALTGAQIQTAGYHFRTPAGFKKAAVASCAEKGVSGPSGPVTDGFSVAASADGGCVAASVVLSPNPTVTIPIPAGQPVDVGSFQGYYDARGHDVHGDSGSVLSVELPGAESAYLVLFTQGLTEDQLIAIAESGLAPFHPR
jgi:hypothetical protein